MNRKEFLTLGAAATAGLVLPIAARAQAQSAAPDPKTYRALSRAATTEAPPGKIEVVEFFWFGCPHCFTLEPVMDKWSESLPADVAFRRVHVPFRDRPHQQLYFTLESMGLDQPKYRNAVFNAIHLNNKRMVQEKEMLEVLAPLGVDAKQRARGAQYLDLAAGLLERFHVRLDRLAGHRRAVVGLARGEQVAGLGGRDRGRCGAGGVGFLRARHQASPQ